MSDSKVDNGVNVEALLGARDALSDAPEGAQFSWRATCKWQNGVHSKSTVEGFHGLGDEQKHKTDEVNDGSSLLSIPWMNSRYLIAPPWTCNVKNF